MKNYIEIEYWLDAATVHIINHYNSHAAEVPNKMVFSEFFAGIRDGFHTLTDCLRIVYGEEYCTNSDLIEAIGMDATILCLQCEDVYGAINSGTGMRETDFPYYRCHSLAELQKWEESAFHAYDIRTNAVHNYSPGYYPGANEEDEVDYDRWEPIDAEWEPYQPD